MAQEIEVKFALRDRQELIQKLNDIGAQRLYPETFEDNIVLDRRGEVISRMNGFLPERFVDMLSERIRDALKN